MAVHSVMFMLLTMGAMDHRRGDCEGIGLACHGGLQAWLTIAKASAMASEVYIKASCLLAITPSRINTFS